MFKPSQFQKNQFHALRGMWKVGLTFILCQLAHAQTEAPRQGVDFLGPLWLSRTFKITCCRNGLPVPENQSLVSNWTQSVSDYAVDEAAEDHKDDHCRSFHGTFLLSAAALYNSSFLGYGVQCKCPESPIALDQHCRQLAPCQNGGYRSPAFGKRCTCNSPYFGSFCEKTCDQGQILIGLDGQGYCSCLPFYQGEMCSELVCLNGGFEVRGRCSCPHNFLGYHCEIDGNKTVHMTQRYPRYEGPDLFSKDISGTVFSLVMIIVLVVSMYLLMKHRMQVQSQFTGRRVDGPGIYAIGSTTEEGLIRDDIRIGPFVAAGIHPPPPYSTNPQSGDSDRRVRRGLRLPPLPTYEDATKDTIIGQPADMEEVNRNQADSSTPSSSSNNNDHEPPPPFDRTVTTRRSL